MTAPLSVPLVEVLRGGVVESIHHGVVIVARPDGSFVEQRGSAARAVVLRSAGKPFQAAHFVATGAADALGATDAEIAVACGSHGGRPEDVAAAASLLARAGLDASALQCGTHPPFDAAARFAARGSGPSVLQSSCSGKHAAMLAGCVHAGCTTADYLDPDHPWQRGIRALLADAAGVAPDAVGTVLDGCNAPSFVLAAGAAARAFARFAAAPAGSPLGRVRDAALAHPHHVAGPGRLETALSESCPVPVVAKSGSEGVFALAIAAPAGPLGILVKVDDGDAAGRAVATIAIALLARHAGLAEDAAAELRLRYVPPVRSLTGREAGETRAVD